MMSRSPRRRALMWSAISLFILTGCETLTGSSVPTEHAAPPRPTACAVFRPVTWSAKDTDQTITEVKAHNAAWAALCDPDEGPPT